MNDKLILKMIDKHVTNKETKRVGYDRRVICFSVPAEMKTDFDNLQVATNKQFVKVLKDLTEEAIRLAKTKVAV